MMKSFVSAIISMSLISSPVLAQASLPATSQAAAAVPAQEHVDGQQAMGNYTWWIIGGLVLGALILILVLNDDNNESPASP